MLISLAINVPQPPTPPKEFECPSRSLFFSIEFLLGNRCEREIVRRDREAS